MKDDMGRTRTKRKKKKEIRVKFWLKILSEETTRGTQKGWKFLGQLSDY
jgi:hypothetical protein